MSKILITGGAGFIGSHLVEAFSKKNEVVILDNLFQGNKLKKIKGNYSLIKSDVRDFDTVKFYSKNCDVIIHLAAIIGVDIVAKNNLLTMESEMECIKNVSLSAVKNNIKKIIYTSTSAVYGKLNYKKKVKENDIVAPESAYAISKRMCEIYLYNLQKKYNIDCTILRPFNIYGLRQDTRMVMPRFINMAKRNKPIIIYENGQQTRDFTHVSDFVKVTELSIKKLKKFNILNVSYGKDCTINNLVKIIINSTNSKSKIKHIKTPDELKEFQVKKRCGSNLKIKKLLNFKPRVDLNSGIKDLLL